MVDIITPLLLGTLCVLVWSIMYKVNDGYRIAEDLTVGVMAGYVFNIGVQNVNRMNIQPLLNGDYSQLITIGLGLLLWAQLVPGIRQFSRYSMAVISGVGTGIALTGTLYGQILGPLKGLVTPPTGGMMGALNHALFGIAAAGAVIFFLYTIKPTSFSGAWKPVSTLGILFVYVALGTIGGSMLVSNATFIYDRCQWFVYTPYAWIPLVGGGLVILYDIIRNRT